MSMRPGCFAIQGMAAFRPGFQDLYSFCVGFIRAGGITGADRYIASHCSGWRQATTSGIGREYHHLTPPERDHIGTAIPETYYSG